MATALQKIELSIEEQKKRLAQLQAKRQAISAREKAAVQKVQRAEDTRRKILLGAFVLSRLSLAEIKKLELGGITISDYFIRDDDRALFGLDSVFKPDGGTQEADRHE